MEMLMILGAFVLLALAAPLRGHDSRDGRRELW